MISHRLQTAHTSSCSHTSGPKAGIIYTLGALGCLYLHINTPTHMYILWVPRLRADVASFLKNGHGYAGGYHSSGSHKDGP